MSWVSGNSEDNFYKLLNVRRSANQETIEIAYAKMALKHHPDVAGDSPKVQERFANINKAYIVLSKPLDRAEYDKNLGLPVVEYQEPVYTPEVVTPEVATPEIVTDVGPNVSGSASEQAEEVVKKAEHKPENKPDHKQQAKSGIMSQKKLERIKQEAKKLITKGDFWRANALMRKAVADFPRDIQLRKLLAKAAQGRGRLREAVDELKKASEVEYFNPEIHCLIGDMYLQAKQIERAEKSYNDALSWQEDYKPASKGLEKIRELRRQNLPKWKKLFRMGK